MGRADSDLVVFVVDVCWWMVVLVVGNSGVRSTTFANFDERVHHAWIKSAVGSRNHDRHGVH